MNKVCKICGVKEGAGIFVKNTGKMCKSCHNEKKKESYHKNKILKVKIKKTLKKCELCNFIGELYKFRGKKCNPCHNRSVIEKRNIILGLPAPIKQGSINKVCKKCNYEGDKSLFHGRLCKNCYNKPKHKPLISTRKCRECKLQKELNYNCIICETCKVIIKQNKIESNRDSANKYYADHRDAVLLQKSENREKTRISQRKYKNYKRKTDILFYLRDKMSSAIRAGLKRNGATKNGKSINNYLPYAIEELKLCLENKFEPWMTWENHGMYRKKLWNDNDQSTWRWNIDHIIPHSTFLYVSMEEDGFKKCWALDNLRPYSAKQNILDGNRREVF